jgi:ABC-type sugar transport system ATPase subunit
MNNSTYLLEASKLCKDFNGVRVLSNVDFTLRSGEIHALIGENGAGKSTFVKILSGVHQATEGSFKVKGNEVTFKSVKESENAGILTIHQEINLVPYFNAYQNIFIGNEKKGRLGLLDEKEMAKKAEEVLAKLNIKLDVTKPVSNFNTSLQRIVQICSALIYEPDILIFDEPTTALGEEEREKLLDIIVGLKETGIGIIFISHNIEEIVAISDRVTVFKDGLNVGTLEKEDINGHKIVSMMVGGQDYEVFKRESEVNLVNQEEVLRVENLRTGKLKGINFALRRGEILGIAGVIGAGKTEISKAIFGLDKLQEGKIYIKGDLYDPRSTRSVRRGLALVPEERRIQGLIPNFTVQENITLAYMNKFAGKMFMNKALEKKTALDRIGELSIKTTGPRQIVKYLSGGNQQKVVLSKWLSGDFSILMLDEPTKGIDVNAKRDIYKLIHELSLQGKGILFMSSYLPELLNFCDRILVMNDGAIVGEYPSSGPQIKETITHAMLGGKTNEHLAG